MIEKSAFTAHNNVHLCGKIIHKTTKKKEILFTLSCGHGRRQRKNKNGLILRDVITVHFFDETVEYYNERFETGDFVTVNAIAQTVRNHYEGTYDVQLWGIMMNPKRVNGKTIPDCNNVHIRGKIDSVNVISKDYILINVLTKVEKSYRNTNETSSVEKITDSFKSITPVGIRCNGDAKDIAWKNYTEGTWVDVKGFVYGNKIRKQSKQIRVERIIAKTVTIVGNVQPHKIIL